MTDYGEYKTGHMMGHGVLMWSHWRAFSNLNFHIEESLVGSTLLECDAWDCEHCTDDMICDCLKVIRKKNQCLQFKRNKDKLDESLKSKVVEGLKR